MHDAESHAAVWLARRKTRGRFEILRGFLDSSQLTEDGAARGTQPRRSRIVSHANVENVDGEPAGLMVHAESGEGNIVSLIARVRRNLAPEKGNRRLNVIAGSKREGQQTERLRASVSLRRQLLQRR